MKYNVVKNRFTEAIDGVISGVTKQASGLNDILQNFQDNDNYLNQKINDEGIPIWVSGKAKAGGFVKGSDNSLYQLKVGGDNTKDPAGSEGETNWDSYLSKEGFLELHNPSNIVHGGFVLNFNIASDKNIHVFTVTEKGLYTFNMVYIQDMAQTGDDAIEYIINGSNVASSPSINAGTALRNQLITTTFTVYCNAGDVLKCSGFNTSVKDFRSVTQSYSYIK